MKLASLHIICEYKKRAVAPGIRPSTSTLHYTLTTYGEKFLRTVENEPQTDASYRSVAATRSPTNLRSVPVAENLTHLYR